MALALSQPLSNGARRKASKELLPPDADGWQGTSRLGQVVVINRDGKVVDA